MADLKVTLIVAIYNVEKYLRECIESLVNQTYRNIEIILVDDGAKDSCPAICDEYKQKDSSIIVIHKPNGGLVSARKAGINAATGDYVLNVDGDDFIEPDMVQHMVEKAVQNNADVVVSGYKLHSEKNIENLRNQAESGIYTGEKLKELKDGLFYARRFYESQIIPAVWNKLIKLSILKPYQLVVPEKIRMGEDIAVTFPVIYNSSCVVVDNEFAPYHYRVVENSMSRKSDDTFFERTEILFKYLDGIFAEQKVYSSLNYYKIFMLYTGFLSYISGRRNVELLKQHKVIGSKLNICDCSGFKNMKIDSCSKDQKLFVKCISKQNADRYIRHFVFKRIINKLVK